LVILPSTLLSLNGLAPTCLTGLPEKIVLISDQAFFKVRLIQIPSMRKHCLLLLFTIISAFLIAQNGDRSVFKAYQPVSFQAKDKLTSSPLFQLAPSVELRRVYSHESITGWEHVKYHQYQDGLRVLSGTIVFHTKDDLLHSASGRLAEQGQTDKDFLLSTSQTEQLAHLRLSQELKLTKGLSVAKTSRAFANAGYPSAGGPTVAVYIVNLKAETGPEGLPVDTEVIVNASSGRVMACLSNIHTETVIGHGDGLYSQDMSFPVDSLAPDAFSLYDESRGGGIFAYDITNDYIIPTDEDNVWESDLEGHQAMVDGYYASVKFYDFLQDRFDRNSIDDAGFPLVANMNQHTFVNAFWNGSETTYGNGNCDNYKPLTTFTVVGHEYAHGLTQFTSDLIYRNESGALNESISDIFGKALQFYYDNDHFDWRIGDQIRRNQEVRYFRDMADPTLRNHPKLYKGENWRTGPADAGGVHSNSGVFNFWFYLLVEGKKDTNEEGEAYDVTAIGMDSALQLVYLLETAYLTESSGYQECHDFSLLAAAELFGEVSEKYASVVEAWKAVGLPAGPVDGGGSIGLDVFIDTYHPENFEDYRLCPAELEDFIYSIGNLPDTEAIPYGSILNGSVIFTSFTDTGIAYDTFAYANVETSSDNYSNFGDMTLNISHQVLEGIDFLRLAGDFEIRTLEGQVYTISASSFLFVNTITEPGLGFRFNNIEAPCSFPQVTSDGFTIDLPRCNGLSGGLIRVVYTNGTDEVVFEENLEGVSGSSVSLQPTTEVDLSTLGSVNGIDFTMSYILGDEETLLLADSYSGYFAEEITEETLYEFDDTRAAKIGLGIQFCEACLPDFSDEKLHFMDTSFINQIEDCIPYDEYFTSLVTGFDQEQPSSISVCVDTEEIDEPHLVFTLNQEDSPDFTDLENPYLHMVDVRDESGSSILSEPIITTGGNDLEVEIPLAQDFAGLLTIHVISRGVTTTIDNLGVTAGAPSPTRRLDAGAFEFSYQNPIQGQLEVRTNQVVPRSTEARLISSTGQVIDTKMMLGNRLTMETGTLPSGLYFITISDGSTFSWTGKIVRR